MRTLTGYIIILFVIPILILLAISSFSELKKVKSIEAALAENIQIEKVILPQTSYVMDKNERVITELYKPVNRISIPYTEIPPFLFDLFILTEDQHFYDHVGFDFVAMGRALAVNSQADGIEQGGSTITQQLARNLYLNHERTYNRKLTELLYSYTLEQTYSKDSILELYINTIYFQNGAYGIEAAAHFYFQKRTSELSKAEVAFLAAIPNNPTKYDPLKNFNETKNRQERMIDILVQNGALQAEEAAAIKSEPIKIKTANRIDQFIQYTDYVQAELEELIAEAYEIDLTNSNLIKAKKDELLASGVIIHTALNPTLQDKAQKAVEKYLPYKDIEGATTVIDHRLNQIAAITGGKSYQKQGFHRGYQAFRQPGSAIKPLLVYAPYINRFQPTLYERVNAGSYCIQGYCPKNYGGGTYGMVTLESAFKYSYNTPAVRLLMETGITQAFSDFSKFGFQKIIEKDQVPAAAVGGLTYGVSPLEITRAYTTFARNGTFSKARAITKVTDLDGNIVLEWKRSDVSIWSENTVEKVRALMQKTVISGTARKAYFSSNQYAGGKTGTTNDFKDFWFVGLSDQYTCGVWIGKDTPTNMEWLHNTSPQLLIWREIMQSTSQ